MILRAAAPDTDPIEYPSQGGSRSISKTQAGHRGFTMITALLLALAGTFCLGRGLWIPAKAELAQALLKISWRAAQRGVQNPRPWPWADTWPVARLRVPGLGIDEIVLEGASGASMAFGPGHLDGSAAAGDIGNCVISAHRDTHFAFLEKLGPGDIVEVENTCGIRTSYRITSKRVLHENRTDSLESGDTRELTLITCYPFHALLPGGPLRWVLRGRAEL